MAEPQNGICSKCKQPTRLNELLAYNGQCENCNVGNVPITKKGGISQKSKRSQKQSNIKTSNH